MLLRVLLMGLLAAVVSHGVSADEQPDYREGQHYQEIDPPRRSGDAEKIQVVEFFWYGCPHCFRFQPLIKSWLSRQEDDVAFVKMPMVGGSVREMHARAHYTAKSLGIENELDEAIFSAVNMERRPLRSEDTLEELFAEHGVDADDFRGTFNSFGVSSQVRQAGQRLRDYGVRGTPEMVVAGRYRISTQFDGVRSHSDMLRVVDHLVERERSRRAR